MDSPTDSNSPRPSRMGLVLTLGLGVLAALGLLAYLGTARPPAPPVPAPRPAAPTPVPAPRLTPSIPEAPGAGRIEVTASVDGATVSIDGHPLGAAPRTAGGLSSGMHQVRVEKPGYLPFRRAVRVQPGHTIRLRAQLAPEPSRFRIESDVPGALVFVDRQYLGTTPLETTAVAPGPHHLNVSADGYEMYSETIEVPRGPAAIQVRLADVRLDASVEVVHKHAIGSCRGRLVATLDGVRYRTEHKDHGFSVPLDRIERFDLDYLKKSLRVKPRGGKTYDFTDPRGDADTLLVFHQAVEKVRSPK